VEQCEFSQNCKAPTLHDSVATDYDEVMDFVPDMCTDHFWL